MKLPLIDLGASFVSSDKLANCYIIGVQHLLPTTLLMFQALIEKGLKPENISLIGKCYSTDLQTFQAMKDLGIDVCDSSVEFDSHQAFDTQFKNNIHMFITERKARLNSSSYDRIVILDDGGELLEDVENYLTRTENVIGMEQTSSGYNKLKNKSHIIPIINMARSKAKLEIESDYIILNSISKVYDYLREANKSPEKILIIGNGAVGAALYKHLSQFYKVARFDADPSKSEVGTSLEKVIGDYDLIIGCTGASSVLAHHYPYIKKGAVLVSFSSSDREFDALYLRKKVKKTSDCFKHIECNGITILNCGFPIYFTRYEVDRAEFTQFIRSLILSSIAQSMRDGHKNGLVDLCEKFQKQVIALFNKVRPYLLLEDVRKSLKLWPVFGDRPFQSAHVSTCHPFLFPAARANAPALAAV